MTGTLLRGDVQQKRQRAARSGFVEGRTTTTSEALPLCVVNSRVHCRTHERNKNAVCVPLDGCEISCEMPQVDVGRFKGVSSSRFAAGRRTTDQRIDRGSDGLRRWKHERLLLLGDSRNQTRRRTCRMLPEILSRIEGDDASFECRRLCGILVARSARPGGTEERHWIRWTNGTRARIRLSMVMPTVNNDEKSVSKEHGSRQSATRRLRQVT